MLCTEQVSAFTLPRRAGSSDGLGPGSGRRSNRNGFEERVAVTALGLVVAVLAGTAVAVGAGVGSIGAVVAVGCACAG